MSTVIQRRGGTAAQHAAFTGAAREATVDTTDWRLVVHDGSTAGGHPVAKEGEVLKHDVEQALSDAAKLQARKNIGADRNVRNRLMNSAGIYNQRGGTTTINITAGNSAYVFDRFYVTNNTNQTVAVSRNLLTLGSGFGPGGERFTMRYAFSVAPTTGTLRIAQQIEDVTSIPAGDWTLTAWMLGPSGAETLAAEAVQHFGTGGSPSSDVTTAMAFAGDSPTTIYDASTNRRCWGVTVPSMSAKVLGTDYNDYLEAAIVMTPRQTGNYDLTWLSFVDGDATWEYDPNRHYDKVDDLSQCQRFFRKSYEPGTVPGTTADPSVLEIVSAQSGSGTGTRSSAKLELHLNPVMRTSPTVVPYSYNTGAANKIYNASLASDVNAETGTTSSKLFIRPVDAVTDGHRFFYQFTANAEFN